MQLRSLPVQGLKSNPSLGCWAARDGVVPSRRHGLASLPGPAQRCNGALAHAARKQPPSADLGSLHQQQVAPKRLRRGPSPPPSPDSSEPHDLDSLQQLLGYRFNRLGLLQQACTHSDDRSCLSYKQLAFLGDAALWLLFSQHAFDAFPEEDPRRGKWAIHMGQLLSRATCALAAKAWGLGRYLRLSPHQAAAAAGGGGGKLPSAAQAAAAAAAGAVGHGGGVGGPSTAAAALRNQPAPWEALLRMAPADPNPAAAAAAVAGTPWTSSPPPTPPPAAAAAAAAPAAAAAAAGTPPAAAAGWPASHSVLRPHRVGRSSPWSSAELAEMFEGVIGAVLVDAGYDQLQQLLQPWVAQTFAAARAADSPDTAAAAAGEAGGGATGAAAAGLLLESLQLPWARGFSTAAGSSLAAASNPAVSPGAESRPLQGSSSSSSSREGSSSDTTCSCFPRRGPAQPSQVPDHHAIASQLLQSPAATQAQVQALLQQRLQQVCGYSWRSRETLEGCAAALLQLLCGQGEAEGERLRFLGHGLIKYFAARFVYLETQQQLLEDVRQQGVLLPDPAPSSSSSGNRAGSSRRRIAPSRTAVEQQEQELLLPERSSMLGGSLAALAKAMGWGSAGRSSSSSSRSSSTSRSSLLDGRLRSAMGQGQQQLDLLHLPWAGAPPPAPASSTSKSAPGTGQETPALLRLPVAAAAAVAGDEGAVSLQQGWEVSSATSSSSLSSSSSNSGLGSSIVQQYGKRAAALTTLRHRCRMVLWLGLDPTAWLNPSSFLFSAKRKCQKATMSHALDTLLAAVYLDGGMAAAEALARAVLADTPPVKHPDEYLPGCKYPPAWVSKQ